MRFSQFFDAVFGMLMLALLSVYQVALLILLGWWMVVHDILDYLANKVPESLQILMLPVHIVMIIFSPFYGLAATSLIGLQENRKRLTGLFLDLKGSFKNQI